MIGSARERRAAFMIGFDWGAMPRHMHHLMHCDRDINQSAAMAGIYADILMT